MNTDMPTSAPRPAHTEMLPSLMGCGASGCIQTRDTRQSGRPALLEHIALTVEHGHQSPRLGEFQMLAGGWGTGRLQEPQWGVI